MHFKEKKRISIETAISKKTQFKSNFHCSNEKLSIDNLMIVFFFIKIRGIFGCRLFDLEIVNAT